MPDPTDPDRLAELENFSTPGLTMNPLSASEVRRRGNRMRRRNNALATIGSVAAVAIIATPIALAASGGSPTPTPVGPADQPAGGWLQQIPADFDITALPGDAQFAFDERDDSVVDDFRYCGTEIFSTRSDDPAVDTAGATHGETNSDGGNSRTLALYPDDDKAQAALDGLREGILDCPEERTGNGQTFLNETVEVSVADVEDSFVFTNQVRDDDGTLYDMTTVEAVRVGNALYLAKSFGTAGGEQAMGNIQILIDQSAPVVDQMCTFSIEGCDPEQPDASEAVDLPTGLSGAIPDAFPLEKGLPTDAQGGVGIEGPTHELDLAPYNLENQLQACGVAPADLPEATDTLYAGFRSAALGVLRQLMTFESEADAEQYAENLMAPFAACPEDTDNRGVSKIYEVSPEEAGDQAMSSVMRMEASGEPGPGFQLVQVVRVGQAVLMTVASSEGEPDQSPEELRTMYLENSQSVIDEMN